MSVLAIDCGNTRIKWGWHAGGQWDAHGSVATADASSLAAVWQALPVPDQVIFCNVAEASVGETVAALVQQCFGRTAQRFLSVARIGPFINAYEHPGQLGPDRLAAALGAWRQYRADLMVVMAGTAVTIDRVTAEGQFLGGLILPGIRLMRGALSGGTARLPEATGQVQALPRNTADAMTSGIQDAILGAIERMQARAGGSVRLILSGGDAAALAAGLKAATVHPELVLEGLVAAVALEQVDDAQA